MIWYSRSSPEQIRPVPWLSSGAIQELEKRLRSFMTVMEHGGGGSTLWLAERVKTVITYETDSDWARVLKGAAPPNVIIRQEFFWNGSEKADLLIVDGEPVETRSSWLLDASDILNNGGYLVLDNYNRPEYERERNGLWDMFVREAEVNSPVGMYLNTEFWRLK